jgi:peptidoglycan/LPS O-acetylase OafA/YrhL
VTHDAAIPDAEGVVAPDSSAVRPAPVTVDLLGQTGAAASVVAPRARVVGLDGLRGIAILLVLAGHARPQWWPVAACGVTVFFALSGYLITRLVLGDGANGRPMSLRQFYVRRVFRLAPSFLLVLSATVIWCLAWDVYRANLGRDVRMALLYVANWGVQQGDFTPPLAQMWSLSVEEQFYLLWPVLVLVLLGARRHRIAVVAAALGVVSVFWRLEMAGVSLLAVYYGSICVSCALFMGCLVGCVSHRWSFPAVGRACAWLLLPAVVVFTLASLKTAWPVALTGAIGLPLVAALTALALPAAGSRPWLAWKPLVWFGGISYCLYLWQTPVEYNGLGHGDLHSTSGLLVLLIAIPLAWATTRYVERPFTRLGHRLSARW